MTAPLARLILDGAAKACLVALLVVLFRVLAWIVNLLLIAPPLDPLSRLPGPKGGFFESHLELVMNSSFSADTHKDWRAHFGQTFKFNGFGGFDHRLMTFDARALSHILNDSNYDKPWQTRSFLGGLIGNGIFSAEGYEHTKQRRIIGPAFSHEAIKRMNPIFLSKAEEVSKQWKNLHNGSGQSSAPANGSPFTVDVANWMSRAAFDVIGLAAFDQDFTAVQDESSSVYNAYRTIFNIADKGLRLREILDLYFPFLRKFWVNDNIRAVNDSFKVINAAGRVLIAERKEMARLGRLDERSDLLSILVRSNLSDTASKHLSNQELVDQCSTFLMAGSDSVSVALSWCFHLLAHHPHVQSRLRQELTSLRTSSAFATASLDDSFIHLDHPDATETTRANTNLDELKYLDYFVKEVLRFHPPVHATIRVAKKDDMIPVSSPVSISNGAGADSKPSHIKIRKGTYIHVPIEGLSYSEDLWGSDAMDFNPDRWEAIEGAKSSTRPGIHQLMTFGAGSHSCLGHRFTMSEMKAFLSVLVPRFQLKPPPDIQIGTFNCVLTRPYVRGKWEEGPQLPIQIHPIAS